MARARSPLLRTLVGIGVFLCSTVWAQTPPGYETFPVGFILNGREVSQAVLVAGSLERDSPVAFDTWLLPLNELEKVLELDIAKNGAGETVLRSPFAVRVVSAADFTTHPQLGRAVSVATLRDWSGAELTFDAQSFAVQLMVELPAPNRPVSEPTPVNLTGLPEVTGGPFGVSLLRQRGGVVATSGTIRLSGRTEALGTLFGGSYYLNVSQGVSGLRLRDAHYLRLGERFDLALGDQPSLWLRPDFWGASTTLRLGFTASPQGGGMSLDDRRQSPTLTRTVVGEADPGTLVRLVPRGRDGAPVAEVLVGADGTYRFEDVPVTPQAGGSYELLLYPEGRLTFEPLRREANLARLAEQLPEHAASLSFSAGARRAGGGFLDALNTPVGFAALRYGLSEDLTLGGGAVYDEGVRLLAEAFYQPGRAPFEASVSVLSPAASGSGGDWRLQGRAQYDFGKTQLRANATENEQRFSVRYEAASTWTFEAGHTRQDGLHTGLRYGLQRRPWSFQAQAFVTQTADFRVSYQLTQELWRLNVFQLVSNTQVLTQLSYGLPATFGDTFGASGSYRFGLNQRLTFEDETLLGVTPFLRYEVESLSGFGLESAQLGYGFGPLGSGLQANASLQLSPGLTLNTSYQGGFHGSEDRLSVTLTGTLRLAGGLGLSGSAPDRLLRQGQLVLRPFYDLDANGRFDPGSDEPVALEKPEQLLSLDGEPLSPAGFDREGDRIVLTLLPGTYRLDLDPEGYPADHAPGTSAFAATVAAGGTTLLDIGFAPSLSRMGVLADASGKPLVGVQVVATPERGEPVTSLTNAAGVYLLNGLAPGRYRLTVNGVPTSPETLRIELDSHPFAELNLTLP